jgi:glycosyltransferase involved in cell wall biosynthesis
VSISLVIPTQNMASYLSSLLESFSASGCLSFIAEVIVVNDGSIDETASLLEQLQRDSEWGHKLRVITNESSKGRFAARKQAALAAKSELVFFSDTRISIPKDLGPKLSTLLEKHRFLMGVPIIDVSKSIFNLYWDRSHQWIFRKHFRDAKKGFFLNSENYEQYVKGTGMLIVEREVFLKSCESLGAGDILADDTLVMFEIVKCNPIFVSDKFLFGWEPRQSWSEFLFRLFDRGPGFVQYNILSKRNRFFYAFIFAVLFAIFTVLTTTLLMNSFLAGVAILLILGALSVVILTRNPVEILKLLPLHFCVLCSFSLGVLYGILYFCVNPSRAGIKDA